MPTYIEKSLASGETVVHSAQPSKWLHAGSILVCVLLLLASVSLLLRDPHQYYWAAPLVLALFLGARIYLILSSTELVVTSHRVVTVHGILNRHTTEIMISKIEGVQVMQSLLGRLLGYGTIVVKGTGASYEPVVGIRDPLAFHAAVMKSSGPARVS